MARPPLTPLAGLLALLALAHHGEAIVVKSSLRSKPESDQPGSEVIEAAEAASPRTGYPSSAYEGIQSVPVKVWLIGIYLAAMLISSAIRQRSTGGTDKRAADKDMPVGQQTAATPAAAARSEAKPLLPDKKRPSAREAFEAAAILLVWMVVSPMFILLNKWCFTTGGFPFPVTLTAMHMGTCFAVFGAMSWLPKGVRTRIMPDVDTPIPWGVYCKGFLPAALLMTMSLGLANVALLHASVIFIQLIKPLTVVITSLAAFSWGLEVPTVTHLVVVSVVAFGVIVAAFGGAEFSLIGLLCQLSASTCEGMRLIVLQGVMQTDLRLDPVTTVYRFAPLAGLILCFVSFLFEEPLDLASVHCPWMILLNCLSAVLLNILIALVISRTSAVVSVLAGITKDIGTIAVSSSLFARPITKTDLIGYGFSLSGICMYKVYKDRLPLFIKEGFFGGFREVIRGFSARAEAK